MRRLRFFIGAGVVASALAIIPVTAFAVSATKTTTSLTGTSDSSPSAMTGQISLSELTAGQTYTVVDAFQALPEGDGGGPNRFYEGTYTITLSNCTGTTGGTFAETIGTGGSYSTSTGSTAPINSGAPTLVATGSSITCDYSITFNGTPPSGTIVSLRNDIWVYLGTNTTTGTFETQTAGPSLSVGFQVPIGAIGGIALAGLAGGAFAWRQIRSERRRRRVIAS